MVLGYAQGFKDGENLIIGTKGDLGIRRLGPATAGISDGATSQGAIPAVVNCGTTGACSNIIASTKLILVYGSTPANVNLSALPFTSSATYFCTVQDATSAAAVAVKIVPSSGSAATTTGTGTDVIHYHCIGT
jgi:hypothetical protein